MSFGSFPPPADCGADGEGDAEEEADPPGGDDAPAEGEEGGVLGAVENGRVEDGEVFEADAGGDLVVDFAVEDCGEDGEGEDFQRFEH